MGGSAEESRKLSTLWCRARSLISIRYMLCVLASHLFISYFQGRVSLRLVNTVKLEETARGRSSSGEIQKRWIIRKTLNLHFAFLVSPNTGKLMQSPQRSFSYLMTRLCASRWRDAVLPINPPTRLLCSSPRSALPRREEPVRRKQHRRAFCPAGIRGSCPLGCVARDVRSQVPRLHACGGAHSLPLAAWDCQAPGEGAVHLGMRVPGPPPLLRNQLGIKNGFGEQPPNVALYHFALPAPETVVSLSSAGPQTGGDGHSARLGRATNSCTLNYGSVPLPPSLFKISALEIKDKKFFRVIRDC